jgi:hypothetical protein
VYASWPCTVSAYEGDRYLCSLWGGASGGNTPKRMAGRLSLSGPRTLALSAFVSALVLAPPAAAATPQGPVAGASDAVQQAVGSVTTVTGGATDAVERTTAQVTQPVTGAVAETTTRATETVTRTVQETVSRATRDVQPAADDVARTVDSVAAGVARQARGPAAATVPSSSRSRSAAPQVAAPRTRLERRPETAEGHRPDRPQEHSAGTRHRAESGGLADAGRPVAAAAPRPRAALPATGGRTPTVERVEGTGSGAPYPDAPPGAEGSASALSTGLALGALALLAIVLCLTAPGLLRRLPAGPAARRPALFLYALERPG